ncbi:MAG: IS256 family transposase, partial [Acidimicrobiia bacterium]
VDAAQHRWRRIDGPHLTALIRAGAVFIDGDLQERSQTDQTHPEDVAA